MAAEPQVVIRYQALQESVYGEGGTLHEAVDAALGNLAEDDYDKARFLAAFNNGMGALQSSDSGTTVMTSAQNEVASRIQASVEQYARKQQYLKPVREAQTITVNGEGFEQPELLEVKFDNFDWAQWAYMAAKFMIFKPKRADWVNPSETPTVLSDDATIAVFGDWGSGLYGAPAIRQQIEKMDRCDVVLHLGDTYYAGASDEISKRLVGIWPQRIGKPTLHRTLNGNHEMYSGAKAYFAALQQAPFADQKSSCFALQNAKWLLLGLDTSFTYGDKHGDMDTAQVDWITRMIAQAGHRKVLLFSHHQPYSLFDNIGIYLQTALGPLLAKKAFYGWYFGHEHRLVIFDEHKDWGLRARCMGHGGFPEFRRTSVSGYDANTSQWLPLKAAGNVPSAQLWDGPNPFVCDAPGDSVKYIPHGYAVLNFEEDGTVSETFLDPAGSIVREKAAL